MSRIPQDNLQEQRQQIYTNASTEIKGIYFALQKEWSDKQIPPVYSYTGHLLTKIAETEPATIASALNQDLTKEIITRITMRQESSSFICRHATLDSLMMINSEKIA